MTGKEEFNLFEGEQPVTPPVAQPIDGFGQMPMVTEVITPKTLTPGERAILEQSPTWKEGDPVPSNLAEFQQQTTQTVSDLEHMQPPVPLDTPPLQLPEEKDISELDPKEQVVIQNVLEQARQIATHKNDDELASLDPSVAEMLRNTSSEPVVVADEPAVSVPDDAQPAEEQTESEKEAAGPCSRCGWPKSLEDPFEITEQDKDEFLKATLGNKPFVHVYNTYGGRLKVTVRSLTTTEVDACLWQVYQDFDEGRIRNEFEEQEYNTRYRASLAVIGIEGLEKVYNAPRNLEDWAKACDLGKEPHRVPAAIWKRLEAKILVNETLLRSVLGCVRNFQGLLSKLEANSANSDFWIVDGGSS